jgi:cytochrome c-type biogenesis protein CcmF
MLASGQRLLAALAVAVALALGLLAATRGGPVLAPLGVGLGVFLVLSSVNEIASRSWARGRGAWVALRRAAGLPRAAWGASIAHAGVGLTVIGIAASAWSAEGLGTVRPGDRIVAGPYAARLDSVVPRTGPNYRETLARLTMTTSDGDRVLGPLETGKRFYATRGTSTTEAGIMTLGFTQLYASFGEVQPDGSIGLRLYYKPLVTLIWLGAVVMALGGALSLSDRRFRLGVPARAKRLGPIVVPAE